MADEKGRGSHGIGVPFVFVRHGDPLPVDWMARHPGWVKFPATLVPRPAPRRVVSGGAWDVAGAGDSSGGPMSRPASVGAPVVRRRRVPVHRLPTGLGGFGMNDAVAAHLRASEVMDGAVAAYLASVSGSPATSVTRPESRRVVPTTAQDSAGGLVGGPAPIVNSEEAKNDATLISQNIRNQQPSQDEASIIQGSLANPGASIEKIRSDSGLISNNSIRTGNIYQQVIGQRNRIGYEKFLTAAKIINSIEKVKIHEEEEFEKLISLREGYRNTVYLDILGNPTVGIGHLVTSGDNLIVGNTISDEAVFSLFKVDGKSALVAARYQAAQAGITDPMFISYLASVNYQLSVNWTNVFPGTWNLIMNGNYQEAANTLYGTHWSIRTPVRVQDFQGALNKLLPKEKP